MAYGLMKSKDILINVDLDYCKLITLYNQDMKPIRHLDVQYGYMQFMLRRYILTSDTIRHLRLLQLSLGPRASDLFTRNLPDISWCGGLPFDCRGDYVNDSADNSLLLMEVSDFIDGDLECTHTRVIGRTVVDSITLVGKPRLDGGVVQPLNNLWRVDPPERDCQ